MEFIATVIQHFALLHKLFQSLVGSGVYCDAQLELGVGVMQKVSIPSREWSLLRRNFGLAQNRERVVSIPSREWSLLRLLREFICFQFLSFNP